MKIEHKQKLELIAKNKNNLSQDLMTSLIGEIRKMPEVKAEISKGIRQSSNKKEANDNGIKRISVKCGKIAI